MAFNKSCRVLLIFFFFLTPTLFSKIAILFSGNLHEDIILWTGMQNHMFLYKKFLVHPGVSDFKTELSAYTVYVWALFQEIKKELIQQKISIDFIIAQSYGHLPALAASDIITEIDMHRLTQKIGKMLSAYFQSLHHQYGPCTRITVMAADARFRLFKSKFDDVFLSAILTPDQCSFISLKKTKSKFLQKFFDTICLQAPCLPVHCSLLLPIYSQNQQILQSVKWRPLKYFIISDTQGKVLWNQNQVYKAVSCLWFEPQQIAKMCKTIRKNDITHIIVIGQDPKGIKTLKTNMFDVEIYSISIPNDIQGLKKWLQA